MIDTDKYEGHSPPPWLWYEDEGLDLVVADDQCRTVIEEVKALNTDADAQLIADAPLLLAEVKRLRAENELYNMCIFASHFRDKPGSALRKLSQMRFNQRREEE